MTPSAISSTSAVAGSEISRNETRLKEVAEGFEALFLQQMLKSARSASLGEGLFDSSGQEKVQSLLDQTLTETGASHSNLGIARALYQQFSAAAGSSDR